MRPDRLVAEAAELDLELLSDDGAQPLGGRTRLFGIVVDMRVIAPVRDGITGVGHRALLAGEVPLVCTIRHLPRDEIDRSESICKRKSAALRGSWGWRPAGVIKFTIIAPLTTGACFC